MKISEGFARARPPLSRGKKKKQKEKERKRYYAMKISCARDISSKAPNNIVR